jgi:hypothetical protein
VQVPLHGIPFCSDKSVYAVPKISIFSVILKNDLEDMKNNAVFFTDLG